MKNAIASVLVLLGACLVSGCQGAADEQEPRPVATVEIQVAGRHPIQETLVAYGTVEFSPTHTHALTVQLESEVAEQFVLPGALVTQGQALLKLMPSAASRLDVDKASREASVAEGESQRVRRLRDLGLATDSELRSAQAAAQSALQLRDSLHGRMGSNGMTLRAPVDGIVDSFTAQPGELLAPGTLLMRIVDPQAVQVKLGLEPDEIARVQKGQPVTLTAQTSSAAGHISEIDARVDALSRMAGAWAKLDGSTRLVPGTPLQGRIVIDTHSQALTVPRSAVLYEGRNAFVFVAEGSKALRKSVTTGLSDETQVEIVKGLAAGERVIVSGNYELEDAMPIRLADEQADRP